MSLPGERRGFGENLAQNKQHVVETKYGLAFAFDENLRVIAYAEEQETYVRELRELLLSGALARLESEGDGNYEIYGPHRTYYVTMTPERGFVGLLSSWTPQNPPHDVFLKRRTADGVAT